MMRAATLAMHRSPRSLAAAYGGSAAALVVVALAAAHARSPLHFLLLVGFGVLLVALAACDAATLLLPNRLMYPALLAALALAGTWPDHSLASSLAGGLLGGGAMLAAFLLLPGFGAGDVKLCALIGLLVGVHGLLPALMAGVLLNGLVVALGLAARRLSVRGVMPYGPGLVAGALLVLLLAHG